MESHLYTLNKFKVIKKTWGNYKRSFSKRHGCIMYSIYTFDYRLQVAFILELPGYGSEHILIIMYCTNILNINSKVLIIIVFIYLISLFKLNLFNKYALLIQ